MSNFTHLHLHTEYSLLDGANKLDELASVLKHQGVKSVAITDHGNMFGAIDFYKTMKKNGIKPIIGMEGYIHNGENLDDKEDKNRFHIILLAKNETGYKNLMKLSSLAYLEGFYRNPRINKKLLRENCEGLICSSACLQGEVNFHLNLSERNLKRGAKGYEKAKEVALEYKEMFGDDFYLEIMRHGIGDQRKIDDQVIRLAKETGINLLATNDAHYPFKDRAAAHEVFMCIAMGTTLNDEKRLKHSVHEFYVKSPEEMSALFADIPEAIENSQIIVDKCNLSFPFDNKDYSPTPPNFKFTLEYAKEDGVSLPNPGKIYDHANDDCLFVHKCKAGLKERLKFIDESKHDEYRQRLEKEMNIIQNMGFSGYMLIVYDFINWAKDNGIPVGPGRGSAAGSLCAFSLRITDIDPLPYSLLFERFLNPDRISMPDIDVDFCQARRGEVIDYVINQYGKYNVAQVATFGKLLARGVIRDVARVIDMPLIDSDKMAKMVPDELGITLNGSGEVGDPKYKPGAYQKEEKLRNLIQDSTQAAEVWKYALALEGLNRNAGMHAAGVVISNEELWNKTPLFRQTKDENGHYITQYTKNFLEDVDLIKFDFLGLKNLDVIDNALKLIKDRYNKEIVWENINVNDKKTYETIQSGNTLGIFQIEGAGMQDLAMNLRPDCFEDIIAMISLYRPGPMDLIPDFIARKHGTAKVSYLMDEIKDILEPTYGVIVYQEQVMQIVQRIGGFSLGEADLVRRAMGKKDEKKLAQMKEHYLDGAKAKGLDVKKADEVFELIMKFASYGFNKSHAAAYSMITFQTAYLKTYYPAEFMAALLTSEQGNLDKVAVYIDEIKRLDMQILPPCVNKSLREFSVSKNENGKDAIIFGMGALKGMGSSAIENIVTQRKEGGEFVSLDDFVSRIDNVAVNKRSVEALIQSGAMDIFGYTRQCLMQNTQNILDACKTSNAIKKDAQNSLFSLEDMDTTVKVNIQMVDGEFPNNTLLKFEKDTLGIYISGHPLDSYKDILSSIKYTLSSEFDELPAACERLLVAKVEDVTTKITKKGSKMGILQLLDMHGNIEMIAFEKEFKEFEKIYENEPESPFGFSTRIIKDDGQVRINLLNTYKLDDLKEMEFEEKDYKRQGKFSQNQTKQKHKTEIFEVLLDITNLNKDKISKLYNLAHQSVKEENYQKLVLKVKTSDEILIYETNFYVDERFIDEYESILVA
ncbi:MAG: DNA polymerase III subunit alpha [Campylobacter sp.]|nr:DNA polymerase III subunit alpha [Campylobacter sp.]